MSGSSTVNTMKKVVQQLRFEASINRVKVSKAAAELQQGVFQHKPIQTAESVRVFVAQILGFFFHWFIMPDLRKQILSPPPSVSEKTFYMNHYFKS
ncbi:guanine nucleotide-binding protein G(I)/G(S)/G(O) subunit gamma-5-like [Acipenser oxyrinchus oxyrinchus]|uniref:Guanine nucleotide-binding protein subunit gamma n=1 Tax=Acipenser oxyrinchus oxyrinchus TaxID=40147 RepID=A0AAD8D812_ACIOX|nr:guanine nucleotide-binding protein G(I)/G(S)/G(O) subunit gamma-5-like [Acipenser oxyrinchus oxyrinchus]